MQKGFSLLLVVILVAFVIGGYFIYQKQFKSVSVFQSSPSPIATPTATKSVETANWKTYTNERFKYSFKYPNDLTVRESFDPNDEIYQTIISNTNSKDFASGDKKVTDEDVFEVVIVNNPSIAATNLDTAKKQYRNAQVTDFTLADQPAFKFIQQGLGTKQIGAITIFNSKEIDFNLLSINSKYISYFDQILSTFKFTN